MSTMTKELKARYDNVIDQYVTLFRHKHEFHFVEIYEDSVIFDEGEFLLRTIRINIDKEYPPEHLFEWLNGSSVTNYSNYCK